MQSYPSLNEEVVARIAALLQCSVRQAAYSAGGSPVYELRLPAQALGTELLLVLWPGLARADVRAADWSLVFKQIDEVQLFPGVEVMFRRVEPRGYLFVSVSGSASMCV
jgi:hypothetical protein